MDIDQSYDCKFIEEAFKTSFDNLESMLKGNMNGPTLV